MWGDAKKIFRGGGGGGGCAGLDYFLKNGGVAQTGPTALLLRSSAYSSSHGQPVQNSLDRASNTMIKSSGLRTEP